MTDSEWKELIAEHVPPDDGSVEKRPFIEDRDIPGICIFTFVIFFFLTKILMHLI